MVQVSNFSFTDTKLQKNCYWITVIGHPRDREPIRQQIGARRTNQNQEFVTDTIN